MHLKRYFIKEEPTIGDIFSLVNKFLFVIGISPYRIVTLCETLQIKVIIDTQYYFYTICIRILEITISIVSFYFYNWQFVTLGECILKVMDFIRTLIAIILPVFFFIFHGRSKIIIGLLRDLENLIYNCKVIRQKIPNTSTYYVIISTIVYVMCFFGLSIYIDFSWTYTGKHYLTSMSHYFSHFLINGLLILFITTLHFLKIRLKYINNAICFEINRNNNINNIVILLKLRHNVIDVCQKVNKLYGIYLIFTMWTSYTILIIKTYSVMNKSFFINLPLFLWHALYVIQYFLMVHSCDTTKKEVVLPLIIFWNFSIKFFYCYRQIKSMRIFKGSHFTTQ